MSEDPQDDLIDEEPLPLPQAWDYQHSKTGFQLHNVYASHTSEKTLGLSAKLEAQKERHRYGECLPYS